MKDKLLYNSSFCILHSSFLKIFLMKKLSHMDARGRVAMVDTSAKEATVRRAVASGRVLMSKETVAAVRANRKPKGDPVETAPPAGIMDGQRPSDLRPLWHPLTL